VNRSTSLFAVANEIRIIFAHGVFFVFDSDDAVFINRQICNRITVFPNLRRRFDGGMFDGGSDNVLSVFFVGFEQTANCQLLASVRAGLTCA